MHMYVHMHLYLCYAYLCMCVYVHMCKCTYASMCRCIFHLFTYVHMTYMCVCGALRVCVCLTTRIPYHMVGTNLYKRMCVCVGLCLRVSRACVLVSCVQLACPGVEVIFMDTWGHLVGTVRRALQGIATPLVMLHQHDLLLSSAFTPEHVVGICRALWRGDANYVLLNRDVNFAGRSTQYCQALWMFDGTALRDLQDGREKGTTAQRACQTRHPGAKKQISSQQRGPRHFGRTSGSTASRNFRIVEDEPRLIGLGTEEARQCRSKFRLGAPYRFSPESELRRQISPRIRRCPEGCAARPERPLSGDFVSKPQERWRT